MRRVSSTTSRQLISRTTPAPMGWVNTLRSGVVFSQWYRRWSARSCGATVSFMHCSFAAATLVEARRGAYGVDPRVG